MIELGWAVKAPLLDQQWRATSITPAISKSGGSDAELKSLFAVSAISYANAGCDPDLANTNRGHQQFKRLSHLQCH